MYKLIGIATLASLLFCTGAKAETIDLATVKCSDLATMDNEDSSFLFTWLLGYQSGSAGTTTMDLSSMETLGDAIGDYCVKNPEVGILSATTEIMSQ